VTSQHLQDNGVEAVKLENGWDCFMPTTVDWAKFVLNLSPSLSSCTATAATADTL